MICEKCWADAGWRQLSDGRPKVDHYYELAAERKDHPCSPEEQCGEMHLTFDWEGGTRHCVCRAKVDNVGVDDEAEEE